MNLLTIGLIVVVIILICKNKDLESENNNLKTPKSNKISFCPNCGFSFRNFISNVRFCPNCGHNFYPQQTNIVYQKIDIATKPKHSEKEIKNSLIMITGAILIVLAAIIFLTSTWNITHNIIKTGVILFMLVVFLAISYISDKYLKLKQTSKTFYYISLAYIPIILLSISMFSLFGDYLSLYGEGKYIYLTIGSILVSVIYYLNAKKYNNRLISIFSIIFQLLSVIFLINIFTHNLTIIISGIFIYNIILSILYMLDLIYFDKKTHLVTSITLFASLSSILLCIDFFNTIFISFVEINPFNFISFILLLINMYILIIKILKKENIYKFLYPLCIIIIFKNFSYLFDNLMFRQSIIIAAFALIYIYDIMRENKINIISYIEILLSFTLFNFIWLFNSDLIDSYILFGIMCIFNFINYICDKKYKLFSSIMMCTGVVITSVSIAIKFDLSSIFIGYIALILILSDMLFKKLNYHLRDTSKWVGIVTIMLVTLINFNNTIWSLLLFIIFFIISLIYGIIKKNNLYKIISYIYSNVILFSLLDLLNLDYGVYVIPFTTLLITIIEGLIPSIKNSTSDNYLIVSYICSNLVLIGLLNIYGFIVSLILNIMFIIYVLYYKRNKNNFCIPFLGILPHIYGTSLLINNFNFMYIMSIITLLFIISLIYLKKSNLYVSMFYLYISCHMIFLEQNKYIPLILLILGTFICYLIKSNKVKDLFKSLLYILCLILYNTILIDLRINDITVFSTGIYIILTLLFTRTIFKKYGNGYKVWEYILSIIINLIALGCYSSQTDGVIYVAFLSIIVILSYIFKFGPIFLICLIFIILNVLLLIGSMPWWIYILIIGGVLIGFAIYNEAKDNQKEKISIKKHLDL